MANKSNTRLTVLVGLLVGVLLGVGTVHFAEMTADLLIARTDFNYRSQRYNETLDNEGINRGTGMAGARRLEWKTGDTRTEKVTAPSLHGAALEQAIGKCPERNVQCLVNEINKLIAE